MPVANAECAVCGHFATVFHGPFAYCHRCIRLAVADDPDAHRCHRCHVVQSNKIPLRPRQECPTCEASRGRHP